MDNEFINRTSSKDSEKVSGYGHQFPSVIKKGDSLPHNHSQKPCQQTSLKKGLKARHITMIAIGGAMGTGLIIGTGKALAQNGPGSVFISYAIIGFVVFLVMTALGEMAAWLPISASFTGYAARFCGPSLGFALGWW